VAENTKALRVRIKSVTSTKQLTKAMGLVASSKIRRANEAMRKGRDYAAAWDETISVLAADRECGKSPYLQKRETGRTRILIIAGDRGLAGGYNANVFRLAAKFPEAEFIPVGRRACGRFGFPIVSSEQFPPDLALEYAKTLCEDFVEEKYDRFGIIYTRYQSMMTQEAAIKWVLPFE